jgi:Protein kinase domain/FHA domain
VFFERGGADVIVVSVEDTAARTRTQHAFQQSPVRIGRRADSDLVLSLPYVSARHGLIQFEGNEIWYSDLGSRNGARVNGTMVRSPEPVLLGEGVDLWIGSLRLNLSFAKQGATGMDHATEAGPAKTVAPGSLTLLMERLARTPDFASGDAWAASLRPGLLVGRFELVREIGRGGFGVVYEAWDRQLRRKVAFKALRARSSKDAGFGEVSLEREAEAVARLSHPNIVTMYDAGVWEGGPYLIMEFLRGETLSNHLLRGRLGLHEALHVGVDVARALAHAHASGVVHRDLKPSNVFLTEDGFAKVLDFGLAHVLGGADTPQGGTPRYMAPEQRQGKAQGPWTDVYAAAQVFCESMTGIATESAQCAAVPRVAPELTLLLARALSKVPHDRPEDGRAWLEGLLRAQRAAGARLWAG